MSKFIFACHRRPADACRARERITRILREITPDNARAEARYGFEQDGGDVMGTLNLPESTPRSGLSLCQGKIYPPTEGWAEPGTPRPDGSYAIIRVGADAVEAASDPAASRTIWYYFDDEVFVASNSQRAVTFYCGRFEFNPEVVPWLISTGSLGYGASYNRFLSVLQPDSSVLVERAPWRLRLAEGRVAFDEVVRPHEEDRDALRASIVDTLAAFGAEDARHSIVALSGGADSRAIAAILVARNPGVRWRTMTGGQAATRSQPLTDASVADQLAARLGTDHRFEPSQDAVEPIDRVVRRFVLAGEGRVDHFEGYVGGLEYLRAFQAEGIDTIIRGDTCFGGPPWARIDSEAATRFTMRMVLCSDIANLRPHLEAFGLDGQRIAGPLQRRDGESTVSWRDRIYLQFRATNVLSALTEIKAFFVETVNPLMSRRALAVSCALPDRHRYDKALFREAMRDLMPDLPYATARGNESLTDVLRSAPGRRMLADSLASPTARRAFGDALLDWTRLGLGPISQARARAVDRVVRLVARRPDGAPAPIVINPIRVAFRVHMARLMIDQLSADAAAFDADAERRTA